MMTLALVNAILAAAILICIVNIIVARRTMRTANDARGLAERYAERASRYCDALCEILDEYTHGDSEPDLERVHAICRRAVDLIESDDLLRSALEPD